MQFAVLLSLLRRFEGGIRTHILHNELLSEPHLTRLCHLLFLVWFVNECALMCFDASYRLLRNTWVFDPRWNTTLSEYISEVASNTYVSNQDNPLVLVSRT